MMWTLVVLSLPLCLASLAWSPAGALHYPVPAAAAHHRVSRDVTVQPSPPPATSICAVDKCKCTFSNGSYIDLSPLSNTNGEARFHHILSVNDLFYYYWNPCDPFTVGNPPAGDPTDECKGVTACQNWYEFYSDLGYADTMKFGEDNNGLYAYYEGQSDQYATEGREVFVYLRCVPDLKIPSFQAVGELDVRYTFVFEVRSSAVCLQTSSSAISPGTIMCIVALVGGVLYLVGGVLFMKLVKKQEGKEIIPNYTIWAAIPSLIKDGALFLKERLPGPGKSTYTETL
eukprot:scpid61301/ scgid18935/ 